MSAAFKNAKKKVSQVELRKLMKNHQKSVTEVKKIESPLAKYNDLGQLTCILCQSVVRSEAVWTVHINAKQHKQNVEQAKKLKERTHNFTQPLKRPLTPPLPEVPEKKPKGILKNAIPQTNLNQSNSNSSSTDSIAIKTETLPADFFDNKSTKILSNIKSEIKPILNLGSGPKSGEHDVKMETAVTEGDGVEVLPEGFFDDPKLDAKARNQEYKDPVEEEWEKFMKEIKQVDDQSAQIIAEDQEEATTERQIDEIDEQLKNLNKVLDLEKKKEEVVAIANEVKKEEIEDDEVDADDVFDEFLDWRSKKSFN